MYIEDAIFHKVGKPARYCGGEWNSLVKDWDAVSLRVALAFPDIYEVGMSNMAIPILYDALNAMPDVLAERVYAPWPDMEQQLRRAKLPLYSLETRHAVHEFDIVGFSLGYELSYTTVLNMLDLSGIPVFRRDRRSGCPLVIAGGSCAMNPEPLSDFIDAFFAGEAEDGIQQLVQTWRRYKDDREESLRQLCGVPGIYVPGFYSPTYHKDGTFAALCPTDARAPEVIERAVAQELRPVVRPVIPHIEVIHDRAAVEIQRGCSRGCRFCQAGMLYRPVRELPQSQVLEAVDSLLHNCGYSSLSLISLSSGDYSNISHLVSSIVSKHSDEGITLSLPSLRLDRSSVDLIESLPAGRKTTLTFAPEAGSERLRRAINKWISHEAMMDAFAAAFQKDWTNLKLYFMIGLPTESMDDVAAIVALIDSISKLGRQVRGRPPRVRVSVSTFVPKPHTPCQWGPQEGQAMLIEKHTFLQNQLRRSNVQLSWHDPKTSLLEAVLARGDRRLGPVIYSAWKRGGNLETWNEFFDFNRWQQAFDECGVDPSHYAHRTRDPGELLPWSMISPGVSSSFLRSESQKMFRDELTADCRNQSCNVCGLQGRHQQCRDKAQRLNDLPAI